MTVKGLRLNDQSLRKMKHLLTSVIDLQGVAVSTMQLKTLALGKFQLTFSDIIVDLAFVNPVQVAREAMRQQQQKEAAKQPGFVRRARGFRSSEFWASSPLGFLMTVEEEEEEPHVPEPKPRRCPKHDNPHARRRSLDRVFECRLCKDSYETNYVQCVFCRTCSSRARRCMHCGDGDVVSLPLPEPQEQADSDDDSIQLGEAVVAPVVKPLVGPPPAGLDADDVARGPPRTPRSLLLGNSAPHEPPSPPAASHRRLSEDLSDRFASYHSVADSLPSQAGSFWTPEEPELCLPLPKPGEEPAVLISEADMLDRMSVRSTTCSAAEREVLAVGKAVLVRWEDDWYDGTVAEALADGSYMIDWEDGDEDDRHQDACDVRKAPPPPPWGPLGDERWTRPLGEALPSPTGRPVHLSDWPLLEQMVGALEAQERLRRRALARRRQEAARKDAVAQAEAVARAEATVVVSRSNALEDGEEDERLHSWAFRLRS